MNLTPIRDVSLFVKAMGHGPPLLLMHGDPGLDHTTLSSLEPLAERFTLVFYDHRCNGRSTGAVESMTWENLTADADALRQQLGFDSWAVLGHSFGGMVALEYALRYPERVTHLLLFDTCGDARWAQHNAPKILAKRGYGSAPSGRHTGSTTGAWPPPRCVPRCSGSSARTSTGSTCGRSPAPCSRRSG